MSELRRVTGKNGAQWVNPAHVATVGAAAATNGGAPIVGQAVIVLLNGIQILCNGTPADIARQIGWEDWKDGDQAAEPVEPDKPRGPQLTLARLNGKH